MSHTQLDNPVWSSLREAHRSFAIEYENASFFRPDLCPFGGAADASSVSDAIHSYAQLTNEFYFVGERPSLPPNVKLHHELVCDQMILDDLSHVDIEEDIIVLNNEHEAALFDLVNLVQPGYFRRHTSQLGKYFGIFKENILVAVTGERMKTNDHTEVSAVVTHPKHTGKGYAKQLVVHTAQHILNEDKVPYLHVSSANTHAIRIYEKLGFNFRRKISFWNIVT